ncbi:hypothetical protein NLI96_g5211 [Meripilus lineatus]|uniref:Uncharacterized protein n=1 Tax=Meripilus lineatus TaxID=2056292 RepID=A0AAD5YH55_9APHY|nr:hypothetical protein NLI96_g5211 [Physisporinus lineatus]
MHRALVASTHDGPCIISPTDDSPQRPKHSRQSQVTALKSPPGSGRTPSLSASLSPRISQRRIDLYANRGYFPVPIFLIDRGGNARAADVGRDCSAGTGMLGVSPSGW